MRKSWEMYTASRMQNIVQIRKKKTLLRDQLIKQTWNNSFGALGVESPHGGAMDMLAPETSASDDSKATTAAAELDKPEGRGSLTAPETT